MYIELGYLIFAAWAFAILLMWIVSLYRQVDALMGEMCDIYLSLTHDQIIDLVAASRRIRRAKQ